MVFRCEKDRPVQNCKEMWGQLGNSIHSSHFICQSVGCNIIVVDSERHENYRQSGDSH